MTSDKPNPAFVPIKNIQAEIIDTAFYSDGFPNENWEQLIQRTNYMSQIDDALSDNIRIIFIEGEEDSGKTTLVAQFVKKNINSTVSVFFNQLNNLDYKVDYFCTNVVLQISHLLKETVEDDDISLISTEQYRQKLFQYRKTLRRGRNHLNIVIDGLEQKVMQDPQFIRELFTILHFGEDSFRFIISGSYKEFASAFNQIQNQETKSITLSGFSDTEVIKYLAIPDPVQSQMLDLYKVTKGYPGRLKTLKRLIAKDGYSLDKISKSTTYNTWLQLDCNSIDLENPKYNVVTSLLTLTEHSFSIDDISKICLIDKELVEEIVNSSPIFENNQRIVDIASPAHKRFLSGILRTNKQKVDDLLIEFYSTNESLNALLDLPRLYSNKREWDKVIELLNEQYLNNVLEQTGSLKFVNDSLALGVKASENLNKHSDLLRYSIQGSLVNELDNYLFWESEVEARISIQDFVGAISLAESAIILVDRLKLLALIARRQKEFNDKVDEVLINLIQDLYNSIDLSTAGDKIYDIVAHLIYALPNLAIDMIEKSSGGVSDSNINDWVIAKLSIAAIDSDIKDGVRAENTKRTQAIQNLNNPSVKKINRAISFLVGNYTSEKVLEEAGKISDSVEKLRLLRLWLRNNKNHTTHVENVIDAALNELVASSSETSITIEVLEELSSQLPYVKNEETKKALFYRFKNIEGGLSELGLVKSKYIYKLNMFHVEFYIYRSNSINTINQIIKEIENIDDILIKLESYSEVFAKLSILKPSIFKDKIDFVYARILELTKSLYFTTAIQYDISEHFLRTIGKQNPRLALKIIKQMNSVSRRDKARTLVLSAYLSNNLKYVRIDIIKEIESALEEKSAQYALWLDTLERFSEASSLPATIVVQLMYFYNKTSQLTTLDDRIMGLLLSYKIVHKNTVWKEKLSAKIGNQIYTCWKGLESDWERIDQGFSLCYELSKFDSVLSKKLFTESEQIKSTSWLDSKAVAYTYLNSIKLILRAFYCLMITGLNTSDDYQILEDLIARVPSEIEKLGLWTELGFFALGASQEEISKKITDEHIIPLVHGLAAKRLDLSPTLSSLTLIYLFNSQLGIRYINQLGNEEKEMVYCGVCKYYITKQNPYDVYDSKINRYPSSFSDLTSAIDVLQQVKQDNNIYFYIDHICNAIRKSDKDISPPQVATLIIDLQKVIDQNLPDKRNIQHDGFKILAELKLTKTSKYSNFTQSFWQTLLKKIEMVPNLSDAIFVKAIFLEDFPFEKLQTINNEKRALFDSIINDLEKLPVHYEFVQRVIDITDSMYSFDPKAWKKCVDKAFNISASLKDGSDIYLSQRSIIDSMYRLDPNHAKELIKQLDNQNQQKKINKFLLSHYQTLEIANKIKNNKTLEQKEKENSETIVQSVYMTLKGLNSDRIQPKRVAEVASYLPLGNKLPLHEVFPIFVYYLSNCAKMYRSAKDDNIKNLHKENFRELVTATNLIQLLSHKKKNTEKSYRKFFIDEEFVTNKPIKPRSREDAFNFIKNWLHDETEEFLIIADAYFGKEDLEILKLVKQANINLDVDILGSKDGSLDNCETIYKQYWKKISDEDPPFVNVTFCRTNNNSYPFHDRWIITKNGGLRLGTSINSLGISRESEISVMKPNDALKIREQTLNEFITRRKREINNERLNYNGFTMN